MPHEAVSLLACTVASVFNAPAASEEVGLSNAIPDAAHTSTHEALPLAGPDRAWTFAYGANIGKAKLEAAGIHPKATLPALLPSYKLVFDPELGAHGKLGSGRFAASESAFANVVPSRRAAPSQSADEISPVRGVVHAVTQEELLKLDASEAPIMRRQELEVEVPGQHSTLTVPAWTYVKKDDATPPVTAALDPHSTLQTTHQEHVKRLLDLKSPSAGIDDKEQAPSARYARLVVCGAQEQAALKGYAVKLRHHLEQLGMPAEALDCNKPLVPLLAQGKHSNRHQRASAASLGISESSATHAGAPGGKMSSRASLGHKFLSAH